MGQQTVHHTVRRQQRLRTMFDDGMYLIALVTPALTIPQLALVWFDRRVDGLSLVTWTAYTIASGIWLIYGLLQKQKPIILSQSFLFIIDIGVVVGVCIFR